MCSRLICVFACLNLMLSQLISNSKGPRTFDRHPQSFSHWPSPLPLPLPYTDNVHLTSWLTLTPFSPFYFPFSDVSMLSLLSFTTEPLLSDSPRPLFDVKLSTVVELWRSHGSDVPIIRWASSRRPLLNPPFNSKTQQPDLKIPIKGAAMTGISSNDKLK